MAAKVKHLLDRDGRYFARLVIPKDLRPFLDKKTELRLPLGSDRRAAIGRLHGAVATLQASIAVAERKSQIAGGKAIEQGRYPLPVDQIALRNYNERLAFDTELRDMDDRHGSARLAVSGDNSSLKEQERIFADHSKEFWRMALFGEKNNNNALPESA